MTNVVILIHAAVLESDQAKFVAQTFAALGDPTRARIVFALTQGEQSVGALAQIADVSLSAASHHLARLRGIRLVKTRRAGNQVFYSVDDAHVGQLFREALYHLDHVRQGLPDHPAALPRSSDVNPEVPN